MPQLGETVAEGKITKWFKTAGDSVKPGDNLFEIETDKTSMEVPSTYAGTLTEIRFGVGEVAKVGAVVAVIGGAGAAALSASVTRPALSSPFVPAKAGAQGSNARAQRKELGPRVRGDERDVTPPRKPSAPMDPFREVRTPERNYGPARLASGSFVTPLARRLAGERGIDLANVKGSGPHGRIVASDVEQARPSAATQVPVAAHIVLTTDVEVTAALALRDEANAALKKNGQRLLALADIIIKAWAVALARIMAGEQPDISLTMGKNHLLFRNAARVPLTALSTVSASDETHGASSAISISSVEGITSVAGVLRPPHTTMLSIGWPRRVAIEGEDGAVKFVTAVTATLTCDERTIDTAVAEELLAAFRRFVQRPVLMIV